MKKQEFITALTENVKRAGVDGLIAYLSESDFFTAPASTKYHLAVEGGLCEHSLNVYHRLRELVKADNAPYSEETLAIAGLLHDVCKANTYKTELRNVKENGEWVKKPFFVVDEKFPYGHGEKSVFIVQNYIKLTAEEAMAINWHMGGFDARVKGGTFSASTAYEKYPLAVYLHTADLLATYLDEKRGEHHE